MQCITFVLLAFVATSAYGGLIIPRDVPELDGRIMGGIETTIESFPYQVSIRLGSAHTCGGTIYNKTVIVTAAHCINTKWNDAFFYRIEIGSTVLDTASNYIGVERLVKHPKYNPSTVEYDVALFVLKSEITFSDRAQPIPLATESPAPGTLAVVSGWGKTSEGGSSSKTLRKVDLEIVNKDDCRRQYEGFNNITEVMLCAGGGVDGGKDACQGDSGGPLVANGQLVGVVSWGIGCGRPDRSGVFSDVAQLREFIEFNIV